MERNEQSHAIFQGGNCQDDAISLWAQRQAEEKPKLSETKETK